MTGLGRTSRSAALMGRIAMVSVLVAFCLDGTAQRRAIASPESSPPSVSVVIDLVRGYDVATIRRTFPAYNTGLVAGVFGAGMGIPLTTPEQQALFADKRVQLPSGAVVDIGHVVTGLEAAQPLPPAARVVEMLTGCALRAAVTWAGDVGQALVDYVVEGGTGDPGVSFERNAPPEQLLGDVDGYVLGSQFTETRIDVAAVLGVAYLTSNYEQQRFEQFLGLLGDNPRETASAAITCYATAYAALSGLAVEATALAAATPYFVDRLLAFVTVPSRERLAGSSARQ